MRLAPRILKRADVGGFSKIGRALILLGVQVSHVNQDPVRRTIVVMAGVVHCSGLPILVIPRGKGSGERIDPGAGADAVLVAIQA